VPRTTAPGLHFAAAAFLAGLALLSACGGSEQRAAPVSVSRVIAERDIVDGFPALTSAVTVRFSRSLSLPDDEIPLASGFEIRIPDPFDEGAEPERVFIAEATISDTDRREVVLKVDRLVPDGSQLVVAARLVGGDADATARIAGNVSGIQAVLASRALAPLDPAILESGDFAGPDAADRDPDAMRDALERHLLERQSSAELREAALLRYDEMPADVVTSPKLRAALAALTGTFAEPAIDDLLTAENCTGLPVARIAFEEPPEAPDLFARVTHDESGARIVSVSPRIEGEPLELLIPLLAHEATHCDTDGSINEEIVATAFDTLLYIQLLTVFPELARHGSPLSKDFNVDAIAMINSGRSLPESLGVLKSPGVSAAIPNTNARADSFAQFIAQAYAGQPETSDPEELPTLYAAIIGSAAGIEPRNAFDLVYLDAIIGVAVDPGVVLLAIATLGLQPVD